MAAAATAAAADSVTAQAPSWPPNDRACDAPLAGTEDQRLDGEVVGRGGRGCLLLYIEIGINLSIAV